MSGFRNRCLLLGLILFNTAYAASHHPQEFLKQIKGDKNEGGLIYEHYCANCHALKPLIPLGAPRIGVIDDWKLRLKQGAKVLYQHTDEGFNAMPARGGCFECSEEQLILAIIYIVPQAEQKDLLNQLHAHK